MKWVILVFMLSTHADGSKDTFLYFEPQFDTVKQCQQYVYENSMGIRNHMTAEYNSPIETVYCIQQNKIPQILDLEPKEKA